MNSNHLFSTLLLFGLSVSIAGCSGGGSDNQSTDGPKDVVNDTGPEPRQTRSVDGLISAPRLAQPTENQSNNNGDASADGGENTSDAGTNGGQPATLEGHNAVTYKFSGEGELTTVTKEAGKTNQNGDFSIDIFSDGKAAKDTENQGLGVVVGTSKKQFNSLSEIPTNARVLYHGEVEGTSTIKLRPVNIHTKVDFDSYLKAREEGYWDPDDHATFRHETFFSNRTAQAVFQSSSYQAAIDQLAKGSVAAQYAFEETLTNPKLGNDYADLEAALEAHQKATVKKDKALWEARGGAKTEEALETYRTDINKAFTENEISLTQKVAAYHAQTASQWAYSEQLADGVRANFLVDLEMNRYHEVDTVIRNKMKSALGGVPEDFPSEDDFKTALEKAPDAEKPTQSIGAAWSGYKTAVIERLETNSKLEDVNVNSLVVAFIGDKFSGLQTDGGIEATAESAAKTTADFWETAHSESNTEIITSSSPLKQAQAKAVLNVLFHLTILPGDVQ